MSSSPNKKTKQVTLHSFLSSWSRQSAKGELRTTQSGKGQNDVAPPSSAQTRPPAPSEPRSPLKRKRDELDSRLQKNGHLDDIQMEEPRPKMARVEISKMAGAVELTKKPSSGNDDSSSDTAPLDLGANSHHQPDSVLVKPHGKMEEEEESEEKTVPLFALKLSLSPPEEDALEQSFLEKNADFMDVGKGIDPDSFPDYFFDDIDKQMEVTLPLNYKDCWDDFHVRLPCSPAYIRDGDEVWPRIVRHLRPLANCDQSNPASISKLETAVRGFSSRRGANYATLSVLLELFTLGEKNVFLSFTLPFIASLALAIPEIIPEPIRLLRSKESSAVTLSQKQCAALLAGAFFSTFPEPRFGFAYFNCSSLLGTPVEQSKVHKLKCLIHYFERVRSEMSPSPNNSLPSLSLSSSSISVFASSFEEGRVTFGRLYLPQSSLPAWRSHMALVSEARVELRLNGTIEDDVESIQADFANKRLGGGVLASGCVQEEIRFVISPELIVSRLICEDLDANEALHVIGMERFANYEGYSSSFLFTSDHVDRVERDVHGRRKERLVAFDALNYSQPKLQFKPEMIRRELVKAFAAFSRDSAGTIDDPSMASAPIATGNWGCGAFRGDRELKFIIQVIAAAATGRTLHYYTFADEDLFNRGQTALQLLASKRVRIGDLVKMLDEYYNLICGGDFEGGVFDFLAEVYGSKEATTNTGAR